MNVFTFTGNLGKQAEQRFTQGGDSIVSFSVAVKSGYGDKAVTSWIKCSMFGKRGESVMPYLIKGQSVGVSGEFSARPWTNNEGQQQISNEVRVNDLTLLGKPEGGRRPENQQDDYKPTPQRSAQGAPPNNKSLDGLSDDIPFSYHARGRVGHCM